MKFTRRSFLKTAAAVGIGFTGMSKFNDALGTSSIPLSDKYGPLIRDTEGVLNLPKGFTYKIISRQGESMADGLLVPGKPDGMATFALDATRTIIIRNHECSVNDAADGPFGASYELLEKIPVNRIYDRGRGKSPCVGGTTTLVYNHATRSVEKQFLSLAGTVRNCAGGPTPWGNWLTCEETDVRADEFLEHDHGYVFEVKARDSVRLETPVPLKDMGRFNHEAVAVDPVSQIVYLTEDDGAGLIYRFIPKKPGKLHRGGKLQALCLRDGLSPDTRNWREPILAPGIDYPVRWIDLEDVEAPEGDLRLRGHAKGAALFARGEGMWYGNNKIYFACTSGGKNKKGQVFAYTPAMGEGTAEEEKSPGKLSLFVEPNDSDIFKNCDNLTVAPNGDVILCEDDPHPFIVGVTPQGEYFKLAENIGYPSEFAGGVFSPDGKTFFVNIQGAGLTIAIEGPWA